MFGRGKPKSGYICPHCGGDNHYAIGCFKRPKPAMKFESASARNKRKRTKEKFVKKNPPDENGQWECYLHISPECFEFVNIYIMQPEHVRAKSRSPALMYCDLNIKPSCPPCNTIKGSRSMQELAVSYAHIAQLIATPEWVAYEKLLDIEEEKLKKKLADVSGD